MALRLSILGGTAGVPGIRNNVAVISPPLIEPTYIETSRINASADSM